jgi:hypothetical protein
METRSSIKAVAVLFVGVSVVGLLLSIGAVGATAASDGDTAPAVVLQGP